ncbi:unnamed protein product [Nyctereutes procyonoides]|uniref:(raccoon dog) hypothetical protein n=1 Tax=Nyctereutes procyonoides TaxID=34880 RepID=A0A811ZJ07_NYCPR|nr:unnamed protein product [Nyctereutes procyonoides]
MVDSSLQGKTYALKADITELGREGFSGLCYAPAAGAGGPGRADALRGPRRATRPAALRPPPAARRPGPRAHLLPLPHPRGRAPRSAPGLPGSRRACASAAAAAAAAAPALQPAPPRAHGARAPHFLSPEPGPADHSPGQGRVRRRRRRRRRRGRGRGRTDAPTDDRARAGAAGQGGAAGRGQVVCEKRRH